MREFAGDGSRFGLPITYVDEGKSLRGTGGAVRYAVEQAVINENFLLTYGDSYLPTDFAAVFNQHCGESAEVTMTVFRNEGSWDRSNVVFRQGKVELYDKVKSSTDMRYIDYGLLAFCRSSILRGISSEKPSDLADFLHPLSLQGRINGIEVKERFYEIGSPAGLRDLELFLRSNK